MTLIHSPDLDSHRIHVATVLQRLRENKLFCKIEKCEFHKPMVPFLGYVIFKHGIAMDKEKLAAVLEWPRPIGLKATQRFLGFANYYRKFIRDFSKIVKPLTDLTHKGAKASEWSEEAEGAFETLKVAFASTPILSHPKPDLPYTLEVDASDTGVGAVLSQGSCPGQVLKPCGFFS
ncbi:uncharacterized protein WCC33_013406 [Rhinophrynus dorsalis]